METKEIKIEIPEGKIADITKNSDNVIITFKEESIFNRLKDTEAVTKHIKGLSNSGVKWAYNLLVEYLRADPNSYSEKICLYRMVVAALTNNERCYLTTGDRWYPVIEFCKPGEESMCRGKEIIGTIESEERRYTVISGGCAVNGGGAGLGCFDSDYGVGDSYALVGFRSVSSKEVAEHISKYFGRLLFEVVFGGVNCEWEWVK